MILRVSLRARLTLIILLPLLVIAFGLSVWATNDAERRAADRFDRSLLVTALGISRDTAFSGGDALSEETRDLLRDTSGGQVFYHVYAPDGVFVTGYATPPVPPESVRDDAERFTFYDAIYQDVPVRTVQFSDQMSIDGLSGGFTFTVWQNLSLRDGFVRSLSQRTYVVMATLVLAVALIVWFGVRFGLRPLIDLEEAIGRRSPEELASIKRPIPIEVSGIVGKLNELLKELQATLRAKDDFISDAAHQLRNPIAGVLSLSEAVAAAKTLPDAQERSQDLVEATRRAAKLTEDLLAFERARSRQLVESSEPIDLARSLNYLANELEKKASEQGVALIASIPDRPVFALVDPVLFDQAIINLVTNALDHGGSGLSQISISMKRKGKLVELTIADDGVGLTPSEFDLALSRFGQVTPSDGSGLGLPIAKAVADGAGGRLELRSGEPGLMVSISFPETGPI